MIVESYEDVIILSGALTSNFWETIHTAISLVLKRHPTGVIIDCSGITEATPAGAETFRDAMDFINSHDARIIVAAVPEALQQVLKSVPEVRSQLPIAASVEQARKSLDILWQPEDRKRRPEQREVELTMIISLTGDVCDGEALRIGSQIADSQPTQIHLVYVVVVPRDLPLQAPLPHQEEAASAAIRSGEAFLTKRNLHHRVHLQRGRDVASTLEDVLQEINASLVVVPLSYATHTSDDNARFVKSILAKLSKEVIFVRGAPERC